MGDEIEAKFLLREDGNDYAKESFFEIYHSISSMVTDVLNRGEKIRQGYLNLGIGYKMARDIFSIGVDFPISEARLRNKGKDYFFTLKGNGEEKRFEIEKRIKKENFKQYWPLTLGKRVEKKRLTLPYRGFEVEFDVYTDRKLSVCEVEVASLDDLARVPVFGLDITKDSRYKNKNLGI